MSDERIREILDFWFGELPDGSAVPPKEKTKLWFERDKAFDETIRERFGDDVARAMRGELDEWAQTPRGALALVLLLDQFTRNLYRHDPKAFRGDGHALETAQAAIAAGHDAKLHPVQRAFLYMPFMHAEDPELQDRSVHMFQALADTAPEPLKPMLASFHRHAVNHRAEIERFGRFPGRNVSLDRTTTPQELEFLKKR